MFFIIIRQFAWKFVHSHITFVKGQDTKSVNNLLNVINKFSSYPGLKPDLSKCELAGIGSPKGVKKATYRIKCINLTKEGVKILGIFSSYDKKD